MEPKTKTPRSLKVQELIDWLSSLSDEQKQMAIYFSNDVGNMRSSIQKINDVDEYFVNGGKKAIVLTPWWC